MASSDGSYNGAVGADDTAVADAVRCWADHMREHDRVIRAMAFENLEQSAQRMIAASIRSYGQLKPQFLETGMWARVSFLTLSSVRATVKSRIVGEPLPLFSPKVYTVTAVHDEGGVCLYDLVTDDEGDNDLVIGGRLFSMPNKLFLVDRRMIMYVPTATRHGTVGRRYPRYIDAAYWLS